jgi:hypothetical protein
MRLEELNFLQTVRGEPLPVTVSVGELSDKSDRTLLYGYTCSRDTWHVYLQYGQICVYIYDFHDRQINFFFGVQLNVGDLIPDKRLYPAACDFEFCKILQSKGVSLPFTTYEKREPRQFHGLTR